MTRHASGGADVSFGEGGDEEIIRLARNSSELHYRHEIDIHIDVMRADLRCRVPVEAPPPRSRLGQAWVSVSHIWRKVPWNWHASVRNPYVIALAFTIATAVGTVIILIAYGMPLAIHSFRLLTPENQRVGQAAGNAGSSITSSTVHYQRHVTADRVDSRQVHRSTLRAGQVQEEQFPSPPPRPVGRPVGGKPLALDITLGGRSGSVLDLNVSAKGPGSSQIGLQANLGVSIDPAAAICSIAHLGGGDLDVSQLLATVKAPVRVAVQLGPGRPLVIQLSPTGAPSHPLNCSISTPDSQLSRPGDTGSPSSLSGTVENIVGAVSSILQLPQH